MTPNLKKFKVGDLVTINSSDHFTDSAGWVTIKDGLDHEPCILITTGSFLGITKSNNVCIGSMSCWENNDANQEIAYGVRIYIPVGCIVSIKKLK